MSASWVEVLAWVAERLNGERIEWMLVGSAATALHGVGVVPGDIDIAVRDAVDVERAAAVLPTPEGPLGEVDDPADWVSTAVEPVLRFEHAGERWTFGKWMIGGVKVELAHIDAPDVAGLMLETRSPLVWLEREAVDCRGQRVPTVPIEVQLATMVARQQDARLQATIADLDSAAVNGTLLRRAISDRRVEAPALKVPESVRRLLDGGRARTD
ncbi:hypothetical protein [Kribbella sp. DT2]|uniref:hypothetical protein n=1 Tax=Kribbella sp. DT2 TaxID=3393427 RepID=UPI003CE84A18